MMVDEVNLKKFSRRGRRGGKWEEEEGGRREREEGRRKERE